MPDALLDFPSGSDGKASAYNVGDLGSIPWVKKIPWRKKWQPTPALLLGKSHGLRSLVGYSPQGRKELDTTEQLHRACSSLFNAHDPDSSFGVTSFRNIYQAFTSGVYLVSFGEDPSSVCSGSKADPPEPALNSARVGC